MMARFRVKNKTAFLFTLACAGCSAGSSASPGDDPALAQSPNSGVSGGANNNTVTPLAAPPTCAAGKAGAVGDSTIKVASSGRDRESMVHVPPGYDGVRALPVVLVIHPLFTTASMFRELVTIERFSDDKDHGFIALFPEGIGRSWNAGECCGYAKERKIDDVGFIRDLLAQVESTWCIDRSRAYSTGMSNGAALSHRLACELPGGVRAIAPVAGTLSPSSTCKPSQPTAVLSIHGTMDMASPFGGGSAHLPFGSAFGTFESPAASDAFWAKANECGPQITSYFTKGEVRCLRHEGCRDGADVSMCSVDNGGHQWPGGSREVRGLGHMTTDIDATQAAVELFKAHGL